MPLRVLIVSSIWPPDIGGPASHGPSFGEFLVRRGHDVRAIASTDGDAIRPPFTLQQLDRNAPLPRRLATGAATLVRAVRDAQVVYATGMYARSALATWARGTPLVLKL